MNEWLCPPYPHTYVKAINSQCNSIWRWGRWEMIRVMLGHEDGALMVGLVPL